MGGPLGPIIWKLISKNLSPALPDDKNHMIIRLLVWTQYQSVTDKHGRTDTEPIAKLRSSIAECDKNSKYYCKKNLILLTFNDLTLQGHFKPQSNGPYTAIRHWYTGVDGWAVTLFWYNEEGPRRAGAPPSPILAVPNVTAHPSTAIVPTSSY